VRIGNCEIRRVQYGSRERGCIRTRKGVRPRTQIPVCTCTRVYICVCVCAYTSPNVCSARNDRSTGSREWLSNKAFLPPRGVCIANCLPPSIFLFAVILMPAHIPAAPSPPPPPSMDRGRNVGVFARGESRNYLAVGPTAIQDPRRSSRSRAASSLSLSLSLSLSPLPRYPSREGNGLATTAARSSS